MGGITKPVPIEQIEERAKKMASVVLANGAEAKTTTVVEKATIAALRWIGNRRAVPSGKDVDEIPRSTLWNIVRHVAAREQRKPNSKQRVYVPRRSLRRLVRKSDSIATVAAKLGSLHLRVVELSREKTLEQIAGELTLKPSYVKSLIGAIKLHHRYYLLTGKLPTNARPTVGSRRKAKELLARYLPHLDREERSMHERAAARGLEGTLPTNKADLYRLGVVVRKRSAAFPSEIVKVLRKKPRLDKKVGPIMELIKIAAARGDKTAKAISERHPHDWPPDALYNVLNRRGICARHPDLFLGTRFAPVKIREIHRESLRTREATVNELAERKEVSGLAMKHYLQGKSIKEIAKSLDLSEERTSEHLKVGVHAVFGIEPTGVGSLIDYNRLRAQHADLFSQTKAAAA